VLFWDVNLMDGAAFEIEIVTKNDKISVDDYKMVVFVGCLKASLRVLSLTLSSDSVWNRI
jgi:hypothetical protein